MKFAQQTFTIKTKVNANVDPINTDVTLTECDVPDEIVAAALIAGNSPRVHWQSGARVNGIPREVTLTWSDWIGKPRRASVSNQMTPENIAERAKIDPEFKMRTMEMLAQLNRE